MDQEEIQERMEEVMDHYQHPKSFGSLSSYTFAWRQKNPSCGDTFTIYVLLDEDNETIKDVAFEGEGCAISTASISMFSEHIKGMAYDAAKELSKEDVLDLLGIPISPGRLNCALLSLRAFEGGVRRFEDAGK